MKIVAGSIAGSALRSITLAVAMIGVAVAANAQSGNPGTAAGSSAQYGAGSSGGTTNAAGIGTGLTPGVGTAGMSGGGSTGLSTGVQAAPALNNMRANGTSLYMSPDPRAPNVSGKAAPTR